MTSVTPHIDRDRLYTRKEIHVLLGGNPQVYLPHVGGRVVAICLKRDLGSHAPREILVGEGSEVQRMAEMLCAQHESVPAFVKQEGGWKYVGHHRVAHWTDNRAALEAYSQESRRQELTRVMFLVKTGDHAI